MAASEPHFIIFLPYVYTLGLECKSNVLYERDRKKKKGSIDRVSHIDALQVRFRRKGRKFPALSFFVVFIGADVPAGTAGLNHEEKLSTSLAMTDKSQ